MESSYPRKNTAAIFSVAVFVLSFAIISCGGGGGGGGGATGVTGGSTNATGSTGSTSGGDDGPLGCSLDLHVPNYDKDTDPSTDTPNELHWWDHFPLKVYFTSEPTISGLNAADVAMQGFQGWDTPAGTPLVQKVNSSAGADVVVSFENHTSPPGGGEILGQAGWSYVPTTFEATSATITLVTWNGMTNDQAADGFRRTAQHEFGHVLFLGGHSEVPADTMYPSGPADQFTALTTRDNNSLKTAYCDSFTTRSRSRSRYTGPLAHATAN